MNEPMILGKVLKVTFNPVKFIILWYVEISLFFHLVTRVTVNTEKSDSTANALLTSCFLLMWKKKNPFLRLGFYEKQYPPRQCPDPYLLKKSMITENFFIYIKTKKSFFA